MTIDMAKVLIIFVSFVNISIAGYQLGNLSETIDDIPIISSCDTYLELFSEAASNMTSCIILHSRPFTVCRSCLQQFLQCQSTYDILLKTTDLKEGCVKKIAHDDYVQMVVKVHDFVQEAWQTNYCSSCYQNTDSYVLSNSTKQFLHRLSTFNQCIFDSYGNHFPYIIPGKLSANKTVCSTCLTSYKNLSIFYFSLDPNFNGHFCMDLSDSMNFTWKIWHEDFKCSLQYRSLDVCVGTSILIALLPVLFYFIAKLCASDITKIFLREKRLQREYSDIIPIVSDT